MNPILSVRDLASRTGVRLPHLLAIANAIKSHYTEFTRTDSKKRVRIIRPPLDDLKLIQRRIKANILDRINLADGAHGGVRGRSPRTNAERHLGQAYVVTVDVKSFFDKVRHDRVYHLFRRELHFGREVARLLTQLTTLRDALPQGAPTSTAVANLLLTQSVDDPIAALAQRSGVIYTRFVDDLTFSGPDPARFINVAGRALSGRGLAIHRKKPKFQRKSKLKITSRSRRQEVTGLVVNSRTGPSISRQYRDNIRAAIFALREAELSDVSKKVGSIRGRIVYVRRFHPGAASRMQRYLDATLARRKR